ncbi:T9SS type A sorting domain-containing protein [candidate division KSB1 bacterium]|nr:T9SS type A sorting domain-containing protein [candidate division KSB1 bacterium]
MTEAHHWDIGLEVGASLELAAWGLEVDVSGYYNYGEISTHTTDIYEDVGLFFHLDHISNNNQAYYVIPYAYQSKNGPLVLDYAVEPVLSPAGTPETFWQEKYGEKSDLAFILLWWYDESIAEEERSRTREILFSPDHPAIGDTVTSSTIIHNYSLKSTAATAEISIFIGDPANNGTIIHDINGETVQTTDDIIEARDKKIVQMKWIIPKNIPNPLRIYALIDPNNKIDEILENNNKGFVDLPVKGVPSSIEENSNNVGPDNFSLSQNYPNPFNQTTTIKYSLNRAVHVRLTVYNLLGQKVATLVDKPHFIGHYHVSFDANGLSTGLYFYHIETGSFQKAKKMLLLR